MQIKELLEKLEAFVDYSIEYKDNLIEQASGRKDVLDGIRHASKQTIRHIIKAIQYGSQHPETLRHWSSDIYGFLAEEVYVSFKGSNKTANAKQLKDCLFNEKYDNIQTLRGAAHKAQQSDKYNTNGYQNPQYTDIEDLYPVVEKAIDQIIELIVDNDLDTNTIYDVLEPLAGV